MACFRGALEGFYDADCGRLLQVWGHDRHFHRDAAGQRVHLEDMDLHGSDMRPSKIVR